MKALALPLFAMSLVFGTPAFAAAEHHPDQPPAAAATLDRAATMQRMQENASKMQAQLARINAAKTDEERAAAWAEHMQTMQANMGMAQGMQAGMTGCPMMQGGGMMGMMGGGASADTAQRMHQMEQRMDMMQMMMERMQRPAGGPQMPMQ